MSSCKLVSKMLSFMASVEGKQQEISHSVFNRAYRYSSITREIPENY